MHEYKGINFISSVSEFAKKTDFILAGSGTTSHKIPEAVTRISKWLSDSEFQDLLSMADVIVFPYLESSQSGTIPLAMNDGKIILVADVGGLPEQIRGYSKGFIFEHGSTSSFLITLERIQIQLERGEFRTKDISDEGFTSLATLPDLIQEQLGLEWEK
jgi:glycosyltransferase involved in cell wall biosynthesis